ncbi:MAG: ATP-binding cassette domain-containing protein [Actinomycetales bacterium]|nr:ATP-binding cassette domain-containing protein [Actinomycetales bacterium]
MVDRREPGDGGSVVALDAVRVTYPGASSPALDEVSLDIRAGEVFGIIGESGAGKSTLLQLVLGLVAPDEGTVRVTGHDVPALDRAGLRTFRRGIGVLFQGVHLLSNRTVRENVSLPLEIARGGSRRAKAEHLETVEEMLNFVGLSHRATHYPAQLSGGEIQRVGLARALVARPPLLLCDEPTSSLDARTTADVLGVLLRAQRELGTTIVVVTHDLDVVRSLCERAALLEDGRLVEVLEIDRTDYRALPSYREQVRRELGQ